MENWSTEAHRVANILDNVWGYNLVTVSGNHIKIGNIFLAITLFLIGLRYSKKFAHLIKHYVKAKVENDKDAANALEKIILYASFCLYSITILEIANIPLSTFAFVGGALAIGIGLGAQTLIGNFISSLIIMVERPLKIGDIIEIEGVLGRVTSVGARCVIVTTFSNVEVLVPNSKLMQNVLVNWTLSNNIVKYQVEIQIPKSKTKQFDPVYFMENIMKAINKIDYHYQGYDPDINLVKIDSEGLTFLLNFYCDIVNIINPEYVKSKLNLILLDNIKDHNFTVEYLKIVDIKTSSDRCEK